MRLNGEILASFLAPEISEHSLPVGPFADLMAAILATGKSFRFCARGYSMLPCIHNGDVLTIAPLLSRACLGDIVACRKPAYGRLVVHRLVGISASRYLVRGDNTPQTDGWIESSGLLGKLIRIEHNGQERRLGLGIERYLIALFSRLGWLPGLLAAGQWIYAQVIKVFQRGS